MFETSIDVHEEDMDLFNNPSATSTDIQEHLSYMISDARRNAEVNIRHCNAEERKLMEEAKYRG